MKDNDNDFGVYPSSGPREVVYKNAFHEVSKVVLEFENYRKDMYISDYGHRVGIIVEGPNGVLLTRQYRYLIDRISWEIPGGKVEAGEAFEDAARRECFEETGMLCRVLKPLLDFHPGLDTLHNPTHIFYGMECEEVVSDTDFTNEEVCGRKWVPLEKCVSMITSQTIVDSLSIIAILYYNSSTNRN